MSVFRKRTKSDAQTEYSCSIRFLDDTESIQLTFKKDFLGQWLFDRVCEKLNLVEKDYFGLRYVDAENQRHWLDPLKTVYKQMKGITKMVLCFRVKFYPEDPMKLHEEITRYYLFLQLRRDLHHGRLLCPQEESIQLAAYILQSEVGDYDPQDNAPGYVAEFRMLPKQTPKHEEKIMEAHKAIAGLVPAECEASFLKKAASMDTYGVDPHQVKDQRGDPLYLGVTHLGIMTFRGSRRTQLFKWAQIRRIAYESKMFVVHHSSSEDISVTAKHQAIGFKCATASAAKYLWRCAVEQQLFFTLSSSATVPKIRSGGTLFSRGSKFRFSGRCQNEAYEASENIGRSEPPFARTSSLPNFGKRNPNDRNSKLSSESFKEEAPVDVPTPTSEQTAPKELVTPSPQVAAPLAQVEAFEEIQVMKVSSSPLNTAPPPSISSPATAVVEHKENGQVIQDKSGILETSIDDTLPYEPNRTFEDSDEEDPTNKPNLDDQIKMLEEEIIQPKNQKFLNLAPAAPPVVAPVAEKKGGSGICFRAMLVSVILMLLLSIIMFYVLFFSSAEHPLLTNLRQQLQLLEPVRDFVGQKANQVASIFKK